MLYTVEMFLVMPLICSQSKQRDVNSIKYINRVITYWTLIVPVLYQCRHFGVVTHRKLQ